MKRFETSNKSREELAAALTDLRAKLVQISFDWAEKKLKDTTELRKTRKDIARILTAMKNQ